MFASFGHAACALVPALFLVGACFTESPEPPRLAEGSDPPPIGPTEDSPKATDFGPPLDLQGSPPRGWHWVNMTGTLVHFNEAAIAAEGKTVQTGIAVRRNTNSSELLLFLQGGNACPNEMGCNITANRNGLGQDQDKVDPAGDPWCQLNTYKGADGCDLQKARELTANEHVPIDYHIFADHEENPFRGWNYVFVPYISGDFMAGDNPDDMIIGEAPRRFRGRRNMIEVLRRVVPTFPNVKRVVVAGYSAGGMGAIFNFPRIVDAFEAINPDVEVSLLADSAMLSLDKHSPACFQKNSRDVFRLDRGLPADCDGCFAEDGRHAEAYLRWLLENYGYDHEIGFIVSDGDPIMLLGAAASAAASDAQGPDELSACGFDQSPVELVASAFGQLPALRRTQCDARELICAYPRASMHIVPKGFVHIWSRSHLLDLRRTKADDIRQYIRDFLAGRGSTSACQPGFCETL